MSALAASRRVPPTTWRAAADRRSAATYDYGAHGLQAGVWSRPCDAAALALLTDSNSMAGSRGRIHSFI